MFILSTDLKVVGRLFQMMGPEYAILCLKISLLGRGGTNVSPEVDLNCGSFSLCGLC